MHSSNLPLFLSKKVPRNPQVDPRTVVIDAAHRDTTESVHSFLGGGGHNLRS